MAVNRKFAADDGNLNVGSIIATRERSYVDIDLDFSVNDNTGDVFKKRDANAVKTAVKNLILTDFYERPFQPFLGSGVKGLLFELADDSTDIEIRESIRKAIENYEPRARILSIQVNGNERQNAIDITIQFIVVSTQQQVILSFTLNRLR